MDNKPVKIYCTKDSSRLRYIAGLILGDILGLTWDVVTDKRKLGKYPVINYSDETITGSFSIKPEALLFEKGVNIQEIRIGRWKNIPVLFPEESSYDLPFDIFAASFYLVTRYEEYVDTDPDKHGGFKATSSIAYKYDFLEIPVIDLWTKEFARILLKKFQSLTFKRNDFKALVTINADQPLADEEKSFLGSFGQHISEIKNFPVLSRFVTGTNDKKVTDPHGMFDYIVSILEGNGCDVKFFFPLGGHSSDDRIPSWRNERYRRLINIIEEKFDIGIEPSIKASADLGTLLTEISRLKTIVSQKVFSSRFRDLKLRFPDSYRKICKTEIAADYTMGYHDHPGFRAGISRPFQFYDLLEESITELRVYPFQVIDEAIFKDTKAESDISKEKILKLINETRKAGGVFISIWHNTSLSDCSDMKMRREVFEFMLENQIPV